MNFFKPNPKVILEKTKRMRRMIPQLLVACLFIFSSCSNDDLIESEEELLESVNYTTSTATSRTSTPCTVNLSSLSSNSSFTVDCLLDLDGKSVSLNSGVNLNFDGGDIINGTLKFNGGQIDGELLNSSLNIDGNVSLSSDTFEFIPSRWDIDEGSTNYNNALDNRLNIEKAIRLTKNLGATAFTIDKMDAYFEVTAVRDSPNHNFYEWMEAINVPSNFTLEMTDNTHLRVYPNDNYKYALMSVDHATNVTISGGNLYGDRNEHSFSGGGSHEWGYVMLLHGAENTRISNVIMKDGNGDGMKIVAEGFTFQSHYRPSKNVIVDGCTFDSNRRNNLTITGGKNVIIENSTFLRAGINTDQSTGTNPRFQIDIEAYRKRINGEIRYYERVDGVIIRNNIERESGRGGFLVSIGENVTIEDNDVQAGIGYKYGVGTIIRNNIMTARREGRGLAIGAGEADTETISDNKIYGNTIRGYDSGITLYGQNHEIYDNKIEQCDKGVFLKDVRDTKIYNNTITSNRKDSKGIYLHATSGDNIEFKGNEITTKGNPINATFFNRRSSESNYSVDFIDNEINSNAVVSMKWAHNVNFKNNTIKAPNEVFDSKNILFYNNDMDAGHVRRHLSEFRGDCTNIRLEYNDFTAKKGYWCTNEHKSLSPGATKEKGNTFNYR